MKNEQGKADATATANSKNTPEHGAESQLHNYNVILTRLGDLFGGDEPEPPKK